MSADESDDMPKNLDELRVRMARRIADHRQGWRRCTARSCRRARRCRDVALPCLPVPAASGQSDSAQIKADLRIALNERMAMLGWE